MSAVSRNISDAAVVDIGSNSIRLVFYRLEGRAIWTVYNEKVLAGLGRDLAETGRLSPQGTVAALEALSRFQVLIEAAGPDAVHVVATAAVRDASDGETFRRQVSARTGLEVRVLSGEEEAHYSALGVLAGSPDSNGLVGDLGGASLEITRLSDGEPCRGVTLPLGPFSVSQGGRFDPDRTRAATAQALKPIAGAFSAKTFNAVGGAWRNIALIHMRMSGYPLEIVHQYTLSRSEALEAAVFVSRQSRHSLERIEGITRRRAESLPHAAVVLEGLIEHLGLERVVLSAYGVREGLLLENLSPQARTLDPLVEGCAALGSRRPLAEALGAALEAWVAPSFEALEPVMGARERLLVAAACRLAELGVQLHPDHRARLIFDQVLRAPIAGVTHPERAFLATAAFARHSASSNLPQPQVTERLLDDDQRQRARALGAALRLACDLSGRNASLLEHATLRIERGALTLTASPVWGSLLISEQTQKRAATLAAALNLELRIATEPEARRAVG